MKFYESHSTIQAKAADVWTVLIDAANWSNWDSGVLSVKGAIAPDAQITITSAAAPDRSFPVKVSEFSAPSRLVFSGGMPLGLFRGVRTYSLSEVNGTTDFHMREEYSGPMLGMIWKSMPDLAPSFAQFAQGLKTRVESGA